MITQPAFEASINDDTDVAVILIHGTFNRAVGFDDYAQGFVDGFRRVLPSRKIAFGQFEWSGKNKAHARAQAATALADYLLSIQRRLAAVKSVVLIGHSHGGNVALMASAAIEDKLNVPVSVVAIGTPLMESTPKDALRVFKRQLIGCVVLGTAMLLLSSMTLTYLTYLALGEQGVIENATTLFDPWTYWALPVMLPLFFLPAKWFRQPKIAEALGMHDLTAQSAAKRFFIFRRPDEVARLFRLIHQDSALIAASRIAMAVWVGVASFTAFRFYHTTEIQSQKMADLFNFITFQQATLEASTTSVFLFGAIAVAAAAILMRWRVYGIKSNYVFANPIFRQAGAGAVEIKTDVVPQPTPGPLLPRIKEPLPPETRSFLAPVTNVGKHFVEALTPRKVHARLKGHPQTIEATVEFVRQNLA